MPSLGKAILLSYILHWLEIFLCVMVLGWSAKKDNSAYKRNIFSRINKSVKRLIYNIVILFVVQRCNVTALTSSHIIPSHQRSWSVSQPSESGAYLYCVMCFQGNRYEQEKLLKQSHTLYVGNLSFYTTEEQVGSFSSIWRPNNCHYILQGCFYFACVFILLWPVILIPRPRCPFDSSSHRSLTFVFLFL